MPRSAQLPQAPPATAPATRSLQQQQQQQQQPKRGHVMSAKHTRARNGGWSQTDSSPGQSGRWPAAASQHTTIQPANEPAQAAITQPARTQPGNRPAPPGSSKRAHSSDKQAAASCPVSHSHVPYDPAPRVCSSWMSLKGMMRVCPSRLMSVSEDWGDSAEGCVSSARSDFHTVGTLPFSLPLGTLRGLLRRRATSQAVSTPAPTKHTTKGTAMAAGFTPPPLLPELP